jgi:hypothetical protein
VPWAFNRKEAKDHGESGLIVGSPLKGRVVIIDDVITAGTAIRESIEIIRQAGAEPVGVALALDRQERGQSERSAVQEVETLYGLKCITILTLSELIAALEELAAAAHGAPPSSAAAVAPTNRATRRDAHLSIGVRCHKILGAALAGRGAATPRIGAVGVFNHESVGVMCG